MLLEYFTLVHPQKTEAHLFTFEAYIAAFPLVTLLYTLVDFRYRFRLEILRYPIVKVTFGVFLGVGLLSLALGYWFGMGFLVPKCFSSLLTCQLLLAFVFIFPIFFIIWKTVISPPSFNGKNAKKYYDETYQVVLSGTKEQLIVVAEELAASAEAIVGAVEQPQNSQLSKSNYAYGILWLMSDPNLCREIVNVKSLTAVYFFEAVVKHRQYDEVVGRFYAAVLRAGILNSKSIFYRENNGYALDIVACHQNVTKKMFSNYDAIEESSKSYQGVFNIDNAVIQRMGFQQLKVYGGCFLIFAKLYFEKLSQGSEFFNSVAFCQGVSVIEQIITNTKASELNECGRKYIECVNVIKQLITCLVNLQRVPGLSKELRKKGDKDVYDHIAELIFILYRENSTRGPCDCDIFSDIFTCYPPYTKHSASGSISYRLCVLFREEIKNVQRPPCRALKPAKLIKCCLHVMGLRVVQQKAGVFFFYSLLHRIVLKELQRSYLCLSSEIASTCLPVGIIFDRDASVLIQKTHDGKDIQLQLEKI